MLIHGLSGVVTSFWELLPLAVMIGGFALISHRITDVHKRIDDFRDEILRRMDKIQSDITAIQEERNRPAKRHG